MKRFSVGNKTRNKVEALKGIKALVKALSLPTLDLYTGPWPVSLFYFSVKSAGGLTQRLYQTQDTGAIAEDEFKI